jgi:hypothetical protein
VVNIYLRIEERRERERERKKMPVSTHRYKFTNENDSYVKLIAIQRSGRRIDTTI